MKTEKKSNEPSCMPSAVIKEEPDTDPVKIKEENATTGKNEDASGEETNDCPRDTSLDPSNGEANMPGDNQNGSTNQLILNSVKQENEHNNPTDELPTGGLRIQEYLRVVFFRS